MGIAGGDQRQAKASGDIDGPLGAATLDVQSVILNLDVEVLAQKSGEPLGQRLG